MPIKKKDGTTLVLPGPNPLMNNQELWNPNNLVLHNFKWKSIVIPSEGRNIPVVENKAPTIAEELFAPEPEESQVYVQEIDSQPLEEEPEPEPEPVPEFVSPPIVKESDSNPAPPAPLKTEAKPVKKPMGKIRVHCLPATIFEYNDELYDQSYRTIEYGEKFIADAGIMSQGDLEAVFWTSDSRITPGSIIYPMTMEKRWWKVVGIEDRPLGGIFVHCHVSEQQPRFD